jgi:hypothetical protein
VEAATRAMGITRWMLHWSYQFTAQVSKIGHGTLMFGSGLSGLGGGKFDLRG